MDLPIRTFRQKVAAINRRLYMDRRERIALMSWQTRVLAQYMAANIMTDGPNKAVSEAGMIAFDKIEEFQLREAVERREAIPDDFDPFDQSIPEDFDFGKNNMANIMGTLGNPDRWKK